MTSLPSITNASCYLGAKTAAIERAAKAAVSDAASSNAAVLRHYATDEAAVFVAKPMDSLR